jgi:hypothetical protein
VAEGSGSSTGAASNTTMTTTSNGSADETSGTGVVDTSLDSATSSDSAASSGSAEATTDPGTTTTATAGTTEGGSSGEPPGESYPGCMAVEECPAPYTLCWPPPEIAPPNFCTLACSDAGQCPLPTSGAATPVCEDLPSIDICVLDCSAGVCPDGMFCLDVFGNGDYLRCFRA